MLDVYFLGSLIFYAHLRGYGQKMLYVHPLQKAELSNSFIFNIYILLKVRRTKVMGT